MKSIPKPTWPNETQLLLLKAATSQNSHALDFWQCFLDTMPDLTQETIQQILPVVYYNLVIKQGLTHFECFDALKKRYLTCYANNHYLLNSVSVSLSKIQQQGIPVLAIKGIAHLFQRYGGHKGARYMTDIDLLVPENQFHQAAKILEACGWQPFKCRPLKTFNPRLVHALTYLDRSGNRVDLHCHVLHFDLHPDANQDYWQAAENMMIQALPVKTLCPTDHLLHTCVHGLTLTEGPSSLRWLVDAILILNQGVIDWERLIALANKKHLSLCLYSALSYLAKHFSVLIPLHILQQLQAIKAPLFERKMFPLMHAKTTLLQKQQYIFYSIYRNSTEKTWRNCVVTYLKRVAITDRLLLVPFKLPGRILWKLKDEYHRIK